MLQIVSGVTSVAPSRWKKRIGKKKARSAVTGKYESLEEAKKHPRESYFQTVKSEKKGTKKP